MDSDKKESCLNVDSSVSSESLDKVDASNTSFAAMDVRVKQKEIEQAKNKCLGDFITVKTKQSDLKKKRKEEKRKSKNSAGL